MKKLLITHYLYVSDAKVRAFAADSKKSDDFFMLLLRQRHGFRTMCPDHPLYCRNRERDSRHRILFIHFFSASMAYNRNYLYLCAIVIN